MTIVDCGELQGDDKLTPETADFLENYDGPTAGMDDQDSSDEEGGDDGEDGGHVHGPGCHHDH